MKKYYRVVGDRSADFSMEADIPIERVCDIMKCKKVRENIKTTEYEITRVLRQGT